MSAHTHAHSHKCTHTHTSPILLQVDEAGIQVAAASGEDVDNRARTKVLMQQEQLIQEEHAEVSEMEEKEKAVSAGGRGHTQGGVCVCVWYLKFVWL